MMGAASNAVQGMCCSATLMALVATALRWLEAIAFEAAHGPPAFEVIVACLLALTIIEPVEFSN